MIRRELWTEWQDRWHRLWDRSERYEAAMRRVEHGLLKTQYEVHMLQEHLKALCDHWGVEVVPNPATALPYLVVKKQGGAEGTAK